MKTTNALTPPRTPSRWLPAGLAVLLLSIAPAHAEQRGKVYFLVNPQAPRAEWQRRPLPGAFVAVNWTVRIPAPAHAVATSRYSELARTDEAGEYVMEGPNVFTATLGDPAYYVYSPGLESIAFPYPGSEISPKDITVKPLVGTYTRPEQIYESRTFIPVRRIMMAAPWLRPASRVCALGLPACRRRHIRSTSSTAPAPRLRPRRRRRSASPRASGRR